MKSTLMKNLNVLDHILGYFKNQLSADEKQEMLEIFDRYRNEIVSITLLNHYVRKINEPYLKQKENHFFSILSARKNSRGTATAQAIAIHARWVITGG